MRRIDEALTLTACQALRHRHPSTLSGEKPSGGDRLRAGYAANATDP